ncbi:transcriptional regulator, LuxR family [Anaerococcus lactolyticus ATCC 51172]|uniref:Transcriptional regulator, LuxR family n=1 Tax=Anaerococcus lactolyticus ATCC 51172 TaxID=525254 RepID=C2BHD6_9FIRM|nr:response regulator transcription factor [Anaerococcus lactolyticus]EEI85779.1 transcriptional regulator, LuxR family [Anaerococcus lactolyticus ATCC 51172]
MKIIILDDHKNFGESLRALLMENVEISRCDFVSAIEEFYKKIETDSYNICLLDINLDKNSGFDVLKNLRAKKFGFKILILSSYTNPIYKKKSLDLGAAGYISKSIDSKSLIEKICQINNGFSFTNEKHFENPLTKREEEVLKALITGKTNTQIAKDLYISERTLYHHIENIYEKLKVENKVELYGKALELGYVDQF